MHTPLAPNMSDWYPRSGFKGGFENITLAADRVNSPEDHVYVYLERSKHLTGPHVVAFTDGKDVRVHLGERTGPRSFNVSAIEPAPTSPHSPDATDSIFGSSEVFNMSFTELLSPGDPRAKQFAAAKRDEILGLINRGTFKLVLRAELKVPTLFLLSMGV
jgi:hypothetical protein